MSFWHTTYHCPRMVRPGQAAKREDTLKKKRKNKSGAGRPITYGEDLDLSLYQWVLEMKAIEMIKPSHPPLKASTGWLMRFKTRHPLMNQQQTFANITSPIGRQTQKFLKYLRNLRTQQMFDKSLIINLDETPMCFDMPSSTTVFKDRRRHLFERLVHTSKGSQ